MKSITRVGVDAGKDRLDVRILGVRPARLEVSNDEQGVERLCQELGRQRCLIAMEASGRFESLARRKLEQAGHDVRIQNPRQVRRLAEGLGIAAKTDRIDADVLARTADLCARNEPRSKHREELADLSRLIDTLKSERTGHLKRLQAPGYSKVAAKSLAKLVKALDRQIEALAKAFGQRVDKTSLGTSYRLALTVCGVGPSLGRIAVSELPENLHEWSIRQISSYAGVAPMDDSSGKRTSPAKLPKHKNVHLKAGLYMPAMALVSKQAWAKELYKKQRDKGKNHNQAIIPVMHKLLFHIVAVLKRGSPWEDEPPKKT